MKLLTYEIAHFEWESRNLCYSWSRYCLDSCALSPQYYWTEPGLGVVVKTSCDKREFEKSMPHDYMRVRCKY